MTNIPATQDDLRALAPELICGDDERAEQAALKIGLHGCEGLAYVTPVLVDPDPDRRWWAARAGSNAVRGSAAAIDRTAARSG